MAELTVAVWQMHPTPRDVEANLTRLRHVATQAKREGAGLLVTPELSLTGYDVGELTRRLTSPSVLQRVSEIAAETDLNLVVGLALDADTDEVWNCSAIIDRTGTVRALYRKAHLFGSLDETRFAAGETPFESADLDGVRVATLICYDVEFPEAVRAAAASGADLLAVPTANMHPYTMVNSHVVPVRAWENQIYLAYANHHGYEAETQYVGHSVIVSPDFTQRTAGADDEGLLFETVDTTLLERQRQLNPYLSRRRPPLYRAAETEGQ